MPFRLLVPRTVYDAMLAQALAEQPDECCGLLAGGVEAGEGRVVARYPLVNELKSPTEYNAEPRGLFQAHRDMRDRGIEVLAIYHSHPTSPPVPSRKDRERNYSEDVVSVIISLASSPPEVRAWWLTARTHREAEWAVEGPT
jgi:[CysO sulfur-carrier protein]-S-L-cysteine hydrolase